MTNPKIINEEAIDIYQVSSMLKDIEKRDEELSFRAQKTKDYISDSKQMTAKKANDVRKAILNLEIPRLKSEHISKIIDICPVSLADLKQLVSSFNITVKDDNLKLIISELSKE